MLYLVLKLYLFFNLFFGAVNIESHSALSGYEILDTAVSIMIEKCDILLGMISREELSPSKSS